MAEIFIASTLSVIAVNSAGVATPLGLITNLSMEKVYMVEPVPEWGNFRSADLLIHSVAGRFSWGRSYSPGVDLISQGLIPSDSDIAQFQPFVLRIVDQLRQRQVAEIRQALVETCTVGSDARARLLQNVAGQAIQVLFETELN